MMTNKELIVFMKDELAARGDAEYATKMAAYMKDNFVFAGVRGDQKQAILRLLKRKLSKAPCDDLLQIADLAWQEEWRELQQISIDLLKWRKKKLKPQHLVKLQYYLTNKSWWDSVDMIAANLVGSIFQSDKDLQYKVCEDWIASDNIWLRRSAIIHQLRYKMDTDAELLFALVESQKGSGEFFINKACGWALRQHGKFTPVIVRQFLDLHPDLHPLVVREASKSIGR